MTNVFVGIGTNLGDRGRYVRLAHQALGRLARTRLAGWSGVYETQAVGPIPQRPFLNAAAQLETALDPKNLLDALAEIERRAGRPAVDQRGRWQPRPLDLDVLLYGDHVVHSDELIIPHPRMHHRWFVLRPLADLDPHLVHPRLGATVEQLLADCQDQPEAGLPGRRLAWRWRVASEPTRVVAAHG